MPVAWKDVAYGRWKMEVMGLTPLYDWIGIYIIP